jgi:DNA mismatch endonuclease (patch repair protein)
VDGCFWHGCPKHCHQPTGNADFWTKKLSANKTRDRKVNRELRKSGWTVLRIWEHDLAKKNLPRLLAKLARLISTPSPQT